VWSKGGVMIREALAAGSTQATAFASSAKGYAFQRRATTNGLSTSTSGTATAPPGWVRIKRSGNLFTAYQSTDGVNWTVIGSDTIAMANTVYVGLAATSHTISASTTVKADTLKITTNSTNQSPTVTLGGPANGATFTAPATVALAATASDPEKQMAKVEFYSGATLLATDTSAPYSFSWTSVPAGTYTLTAKAYDAAGASGTSAAVTVTVGSAANQPPTVALTGPLAGTSYTAPAGMALTATANDPENQLARVDFYSGTTLIGSDATAPFSFNWAGVAAGTYTLSAKAVDAKGATATSSSVTVTVAPAAAAPPTAVVFHASPDDATLVTSYRIEIFSAAADTTTATPTSTFDGGKPAKDAAGDVTVIAASFFSALAPGNYKLTIAAVGAGGVGRSTAVVFTR